MTAFSNLCNRNISTNH